MTDLDDWYGGPSGFVAAREEMHNHDCGDGLAYPHPASAHHFSGTTTLPATETEPDTQLVRAISDKLWNSPSLADLKITHSEFDRIVAETYPLVLDGITPLAIPASALQAVISPQEGPLTVDQHPVWQAPAPRTELIWAAVDLDGCIAEGAWTPSSSGREIGPPIERNIRKLRTLRESGYKIVIHTARGWEHYEAIESWLTFWNIPFDRIVCGKLLAAVYVDDRAVESEQLSWSPDAQGQRQTWAGVHATAAHEKF